MVHHLLINNDAALTAGSFCIAHDVCYFFGAILITFGFMGSVDAR